MVMLAVEIKRKILEEIKAGSTDTLAESIQRKRSIGEQ
tara:strand:- start:1246 stop:1359 length:114 start_codon:yes stop_codon:yes gene_type:complete